MASTDELNWIKKLTIQDENDRRDLEEAIDALISFETKDDIQFDHLEFINRFINDNHIKPFEVRRIVRYVRKLWFLDGEESEALSDSYENYLDNLFSSILIDLYKESDLERTDLQTKRCAFLISLFSDFHDDYEILGICKYDYHFLIFLIKLIAELIEQLIDKKRIRPENFLRFIYVLDKIVSNWLGIVNVIDKSQFNLKFLSTTKQQLAILVGACKEKYKLISISLSTILSNLDTLEKLI